MNLHDQIRRLEVQYIRVEPYAKGDGTQVGGHVRSWPDGDEGNNLR